MNLKSITISLLVSLIFASCSSSKDQLPYFKDLTATEGSIQNIDYPSEIKPDDELLISVISTTFPQATEHYNLPLSNPSTISDVAAKRSTVPVQQTYLVDSKGDITMPSIGTLHVAGMTTEQLKDKLTGIISKEVSDVVVNVKLLNFQVVVAGEVRNPRTVKVERQRYSILDAISDAGDLSPYGQRDNVLIIREENGKRTYSRLNLNSSELLNSPYFYLKQNDYIYVSPNDIISDNARYNQNNAFKLTVVSTVVSAASVIASLVIALTVK